MPGPTRLRGGLLQGALASNKVTEYAITQRAREVLNLVNRCAAAGIPADAEEGTRDTPETAALLKKISADSIVLLKNEGNVLPLKKNKSVSLPSNSHTGQQLTTGCRLSSLALTPKSQPTAVAGPPRSYHTTPSPPMTVSQPSSKKAPKSNTPSAATPTASYPS